MAARWLSYTDVAEGTAAEAEARMEAVEEGRCTHAVLSGGRLREDRWRGRGACATSDLHFFVPINTSNFSCLLFTLSKMLAGFDVGIGFDPVWK